MEQDIKNILKKNAENIKDSPEELNEELNDLNIFFIVVGK